jgi:hypothetical protein
MKNDIRFGFPALNYIQSSFMKKYRRLRGRYPSWNILKFCQFVEASSKDLNIKYLLGWMRSRGDIRFTKFEKVIFSSYFEGRRKSNSCTVPYYYEAFGKNCVYRIFSPCSTLPDDIFFFCRKYRFITLEGSKVCFYVKFSIFWKIVMLEKF